MSRPQNYFSELADVPVHYARPPVAPYATRGRSYRFYSVQDFENDLNGCFEELWQACPLGQAEVITSAGTYVNKTGFHSLGRAIDIDAIFWPERDFVTLDYSSDPVFYLGVEAILRRHFGTVLNYLYNEAHHDHFHVDNGSSVKFSPSSRSRVLFLQAALTHVFDMPLLIDGIYGDDTTEAAQGALNQIGSSEDIENVNAWKMLLSSIAEKAFAQSSPVLTPPVLLQNLYQTINDELAETPSRKRIETALNAFADHEQTQEWLNSLDQNLASIPVVNNQ